MFGTPQIPIPEVQEPPKLELLALPIGYGMDRPLWDKGSFKGPIIEIQYLKGVMEIPKDTAETHWN